MLNRYVATSLAFACMMGLGACNNKDQGMEQRYTDTTQPVGYHTNEKANEHRVDNPKGPMTEVLDGNGTPNYPLNVSDGRFDNPTNPYGNINNTNDRTNGVANMYYGEDYPRDFTEKVADRAASVKGVENSRAVVRGDQLLVAVDPAKDINNGRLKQNVLDKVKPIAKDYNVQVKVDHDVFMNARSLDDDIRNGKDRNTIQTNFNGLFESVDENVNHKHR
ncbi:MULTISPECIES: YhcN/YlaJ family sporulation lipoprotein [Priestia]|jgi:spore cortex protein|uniref:Spore cortex protein CoxA n=4 Tax=Priestia TaxID=2800373 RepID=D5DT39_PRIM1|nr:MULTISPECIES: YhcN/YlaJ family sporulation lipoprotein [Priestia]AVX10523.1 spore cortex protein [Bacillus sp. Y-01]KOP76597.1 spore cortex protein [Bacillus sp. FJAT-21351]KRD89281.1 spore cortex protein [Bacillus sp. Root147]KRF57901.1 spore cortex protein [Bacillus sp. Soil531]MBK0007779.1 YhcN/YlaJ family sporulation lipoprotein [Bacillus sp. S35]MBZ5477856.1 YhcN/YlaJ family sporulation lipoprotein [Bacillus sp. T_4]MCF6798518.1 YhcN/YlaJ family sporulation lipoprotein [Bacillus sp. 